MTYILLYINKIFTIVFDIIPLYGYIINFILIILFIIFFFFCIKKYIL